MADLFTSDKLLEAFPEVLRENGNTNALGKAVADALVEAKDLILLLRLYTNLDELPERILDILAVELRTQYYDTTLPIETKRTLIRNTLLWYKKAGTLSALRELVESVFGECQIREWFDYDGEPGHFRLESVDVAAAINNLPRFMDAMQRVKRLSAHLDEIASTAEYEIYTVVGLALQSWLRPTIIMEPFSTDDFADIYVDSSGDYFSDSHGNIYIRG